MDKNDLKQIKNIVDSALDEKLEIHLSSIHGEIEDLKEDVADLKEDVADLKEDVADLKEDVKKIDHRLIAVESKVTGVHNRIDEETLHRKNLESRIRKVLPKLPVAPERV